MKLKVLDLFSGIGGFSLGLERTGGFETVAFCEIEEYPRKVLNKHWPGVPIYEDVRELTAERLRADGITPNVITGGFPCQDISNAGSKYGINGERSGLYTEIMRLACEIRPKFILMENVSALLNRGMGSVLGNLAEIGYNCEWHCISAGYTGHPQIRDRVWFICYPNDQGKSGKPINDEASIMQKYCRSFNPNTDCTFLERGALTGCAEEIRQERKEQFRAMAQKYRQLSDPAGSTGGISYGIPRRMDRLKGLGNAVVPQIPELIGRAILEEINSQS